MEYSRRDLGLVGESLARDFLRNQGLHIIDTNWRHGRHGEIDIVAADPETQCYVLVEVRTRMGSQWGTPLSSVDYKKYSQLRSLAYAWLASQRLRRHMRIDVIAITVDPQVRVMDAQESDFSTVVAQNCCVRWEKGVSF